MAEHVVKVFADATGVRSSDLVSVIDNYREALHNTGKFGQVRVADAVEAEAVADTLAGLRDALGTNDVVTYHICRHDEGIGTCTPEIR